MYEAQHMSTGSQPKVRLKTKLPNGDLLTLTVWPGKSDSTAEIIQVQIRRLSGENWQTVGRIAAYRTADGNYSQLPDRRDQNSST